MILEGRNDHHGFFRRIGQMKIENDRILAPEIVHESGQMPADSVVFEGKHIPLSLYTDIALFTGRREVARRHKRQPHHRFRNLAVLFKIQQGNAVHRHIPVMVNGQRQGKPIRTDGIIIPLFDPPAFRRNLPAVIRFDQFRSVSGFHQLSPIIM